MAYIGSIIAFYSPRIKSQTNKKNIIYARNTVKEIIGGENKGFAA